jgi:hypothetical protein
MRTILNKKVCFMNLRLALAMVLLASAPAFAATDEYTLTIKNNTFDPKVLTVPAGKKFKLLVVNQDSTPAEFESKVLGREKVIPSKSTGIINLGPLKPGRYGFVEEFHETQPGAQGTLVAE